MSSRWPGHWLPGHWLPGHWLPGHWPSGHWPSGHWLSGHWPRGHWPRGNRLAGSWPRGSWPRGNRLAGSWRPRSGLAATATATATAAVAVLAGCGSVQAPATGSAASGSAGAGGAGASSPVGGSASVSASASGSTATTCASSELRVRLDVAAAGVAAGSYYVPLEFTNTSGQACQLAGYPAVAFTSGVAGQQIGSEAAVDRSVRAATVLLAPGGTAHAWLRVLSTANYPASKCHPVTAAGLRVVAPGSESASYVPHPVPVCRAVIQGSESLSVRPVQQGRAQRGTA